jgi:hypothetical protein
MKYLKKFNEDREQGDNYQKLEDIIDIAPSTTPENKHHTLPNDGDDHQNVSDDIEIKPNTTPENKHHTHANEGDDLQNVSSDVEEIDNGMQVSDKNEIPAEDILYKENIITKFVNFI